MLIKFQEQLSITSGIRPTKHVTFYCDNFGDIHTTYSFISEALACYQRKPNFIVIEIPGKILYSVLVQQIAYDRQ